MTDKSKTVANSMEETTDRHRRYLRAINSPIRRTILRSIDKGHNSIASISSDIGLDEKTLDWHLNILEDGYCVKKTTEGDMILYNLTKEGQVVDYLDK